MGGGGGPKLGTGVGTARDCRPCPAAVPDLGGGGGGAAPAFLAGNLGAGELDFLIGKGGFA